jgi:lipoyl synthase
MSDTPDLGAVKVVKNGIARSGAEPVPRGAKPPWLKVRLPSGDAYQAVRATVKEHRLSTVCEEAMCPNLAECWNAGTATIMLMGSVCTRACRFCAVDTGNPRGRLDPDEPRLAAESVSLMGLSYVVLTSVDRDDLPDGGAAHYARCVRAIRERNPATAVEALTPDFQGVHEHVRLRARRRHRGLRPEPGDGAPPDAPGARPPSRATTRRSRCWPTPSAPAPTC